jgi:hypothetical protein
MCLFLLKFHCELNPIEMLWGFSKQSKFQYFYLLCKLFINDVEPQAAKAIAMGTRWVQAICRLTSTTKGVQLKYIRQFYIAVALPHMLYAASIFIKPHTEHTKRTSSTIKLLTRIQHQAVVLITGALHSTATEILDTHSHLLH